MTARDWNAGDVAAWNGRRIFRDGYNGGKRSGRWIGADVGECWPEPFDEIRPLVVIDPEDDAQVERLASQLVYAGYTPDTGTVAAALRTLIEPPKPPKPDEPTGLGAVVEDNDGDLWIRTCAPCEDCLNKPWQRGPVRRNWLIVEAVHVLSEGIAS